MTLNQQLVKQNNKSNVFHTIKDSAPLSRSEIAQRLGLTKATISSLVNELLDENLCYETGPGESSGGRRPVMLIFNNTAGYSIGIDLGVHYVLGILTDLQGNIVFEQLVPFKNRTIEQVLDIIKDIIRLLINNAQPSHYGVIGIGIGVPGLVTNEGVVLLAPNLGWKKVDLTTLIEQEFNIPTIIDNEANAGAHGEKRFGGGKNSDNLIYISAGIGIGVGIIFNDNLYRGRDGYAGEMGHMIIEANGKKCSCGSNGCWELYASENALLQQAKDQQIPLLHDAKLTLEYLIELAEGKDEKVLQLFEKVGHYLGIGMSNIINTFNPQQIIIGNRLAMAKKWLEQPILNIVETQSLKQHQRNLQVSFSQLTIYSTALGVSGYATDTFIKTALREQV